MSARTCLRRLDVVGPDPRPVLLRWSSAGWARSSARPLLLDPRVVREAASSSRDAPHSESLGLECACLASHRPQRAAPLVLTLGLACCVAGWSSPGGRARSGLVLVPCSMLAWPVTIGLTALRSSCAHLPLTASLLQLCAARLRPCPAAAQPQPLHYYFVFVIM